MLSRQRKRMVVALVAATLVIGPLLVLMILETSFIYFPSKGISRHPIGLWDGVRKRAA